MWSFFLWCIRLFDCSIGDDDYLNSYEEPTEDKPYDYDNYDQKYQPEHYQMVNVHVGDFEQIRGQLGL